jgi:hypothetical protein
MSSSRRYKRYFIILENEDTGFENKEKKIPKGYAKIEVRSGKGMLNVYVQDLKFFEDGKYIYRNYLISTKGRESICVDTGPFVIDERGRGEITKKLNPENVEESGKAIEDFNVIAVVAELIEGSGEKDKVLAPLVGYIDKEKVEWKSAFDKKEENVKVDDEKDHEEETSEEVEDEIELDEEYKEKYEKIIKVIEEGSNQLYKEEKKENESKDEESKSKQKAEDNREKDDEVEDEKVEEYTEEKEEECLATECIDSLEKDENQQENYETQHESYKGDYSQNEYGEFKPNIDGVSKEEYREEYGREHKEEHNGEYNEEYETEHEGEFKEKYQEEANRRHEKEVNRDFRGCGRRRHHLYKQPYVGYNTYPAMVYRNIREMLKRYERIKPFEKGPEDCYWWKMNYNKQNMYTGFLPFFGYILSLYHYNPYISYMNNCTNLMHKYGHYIFGICYDKDREPRYYVYGVPGRYLYKEQPFRGMTGFVYWHPMEDKKAEKGDYGYWLLYIDIKTGNVVFPMKPTIPPMY